MYMVVKTKKDLALSLLERSGVNGWNVEPLEQDDKWPEPYNKNICVDWQVKWDAESWRDFQLRVKFQVRYNGQEPLSDYLAHQLWLPKFACMWTFDELAAKWWGPEQEAPPSPEDVATTAEPMVVEDQDRGKKQKLGPEEDKPRH